MSTRGRIGFTLDGITKVSFQTYDSIPDRVGLQVLTFCREVDDWDAVRASVRKLVVVDEAASPSEEQKRALGAAPPDKRHSDADESWFHYLSPAQGRPDLILFSGFITDKPVEDYFIEWSYVVDLDKNEFRAYQGFWAGQAQSVRFDDRVVEGLDPVGEGRLLGAWSLDALPSNDEFLDQADANDLYA